MKISYVLQMKDFCSLCLAGIILGIFYGIINISFKQKRNIVIQIITDLIFSIVSFSVFLALVNVINMGEFRMFLLVGYILGFTVERITLGKLFAKGYKKLYTNIVKITKKFAESRFGRIILK